MKEFHLIVVGKLKDKNLEAIEAEYLKRIKNPKLKIHEVKANAENQEQEAVAIMHKVQSIASHFKLIILTEFGSEFDSPKFSHWLQIQNESTSTLIFVICGAEGPSQDLLNKADAKLSLSKMTMPHKLARIIFIEQLYRAQTIRENHPYHN